VSEQGGLLNNDMLPLQDIFTNDLQWFLYHFETMRSRFYGGLSSVYSLAS
jgi:hypothetical protein